LTHDHIAEQAVQPKGMSEQFNKPGAVNGRMAVVFQAQHGWPAAVTDGALSTYARRVLDSLGSAKGGPRKITARMVKTAVQELVPAGAPQPATRDPRQNKAAQRRLISDAIGELLVLLSQKTSHDILTQKVEALHGHIQALFPRSA
jgi:hypothetical protein